MGTSRSEESPWARLFCTARCRSTGSSRRSNDQPGPLFDWLTSGDVPLDEAGQLKVSQASYEHTRAYWDQIGVTIVGRHDFDLTDGWDGHATQRDRPRGRRVAPAGARGLAPEAPFHFADGVEAAMTTAQELAGDRTVEVAAGDVGGQMLAAGLVDEVAMDVAPVVIASRRLGPAARSE